jgi:6-pyruvoyltetrahydropterin/6-carboxytetrahydropterin synthase
LSYYIEKQFEAACAHRISTQYLCEALRDDDFRPAPCKNIHGHNVTFLIGISSENLENEMVLDFNHLKFVKSALNGYYDHKFILWKDDPLYEFLVRHAWDMLLKEALEKIEPESSKDPDITYEPEMSVIDLLDGGEGYRAYHLEIPDWAYCVQSPLFDLLHGITVVDFETSSENLAHWMYNVVNNRLNKVKAETKDEKIRKILDNVKVAQVSYKESPKSIATYTGV